MALRDKLNILAAAATVLAGGAAQDPVTGAVAAADALVAAAEAVVEILAVAQFDDETGVLTIYAVKLLGGE